MMTRSKKSLGIGGLLGVLVALGAVACGDDFEGDDCRVNHRCPASGGQSDGEGGSGASDMGDAGSGAKASGGTNSGATGNVGAGQGGQDVAPVACTGPEQCDDGDPSDGAEICGDDGMCAEGNAPPTVMAVSPDADAREVELTSEVVITFSEPLDPVTITGDSVRLLDGDQVVEAELTYADGQATLTPKLPLALLAEYTVSVTTGVADAEGAHLLEEYRAEFTTRDGAWAVADAASGNIYTLSETLPVNDKGDALVSWITQSTPGVYCPTSARWFNGDLSSPIKSWTTGPGIFECAYVAAGANAAGVGAVAWQEEYTAEYVQQFRAGKWPSSLGEPVTTQYNSALFAVGVTPNGSVSFLQHASLSGTYARWTNANGAWSGAATNIAPAGKRGLSSARLAFDAKNNGFAAWRADNGSGKEVDEVLAARYTTGDGWQMATTLPGSLAGTNDVSLERGAPAIAVDDDGGAVAVWLREAGNVGSLLANRFTTAGGWENPVVISGSLVLTEMLEPPGLVFDGTNYVAAWTGKDGASSYVHSAVYDVEFGGWSSHELRSANEVLPRMPSLGVDGRGNLLMTWATSAGDDEATLFFARYDARAQTWSDGEEVGDGGTIKAKLVPYFAPVPLGVGVNGHAAVAWVDRDQQGVANKLRVANFR